MAGDINDYAQVNISATGATPTQPAFNIPLISSFTAAWSERTREYNSLAALAVDFPAGSGPGGIDPPEYRAAQALQAQNPRLTKFVVGRFGLAPTQQFEVGPFTGGNVIANYAYKFNFDGHLVSYTSDGTPLASEITAGLKAALDAFGVAVTTTQQAGNTVLRIVANAAGAWHNYQTLDLANVPVLQNHADPGVATDLAAIVIERNDWYGLITTFNSLALIEAAAAWANSNKKLYVAQSIDTVIPNTVKSGTDDVAEFLQNAANDFSPVVFSPGVGDFLDAGAVGARFTKTPGRATWMFANISGVPATSYTPTQRANMKAKNCGWYEATAGVNILNEGKLPSGRFIDFRIFLDYFAAKVQTRIFTMQTQNDKVAYTDAGISQVSSCIRAQINEDSAGQNAPIDPSTVVVTEPLALNVPSADRQTRVLNGISFSFRYTGAVHSTVVNGTVTL